MDTNDIDINNKPIQETDEIKLFTDEGSLQYAFFYELGSQIVGKAGKSIKKAKLILDFDSPENAEAFQKITTQWNVLKAMLFGEKLEESFDVTIPKEFISWLSVHVDNEYRCIAAQYDKTKDQIVTIDIESFYEDAVDDEFKRSIVKALKSDPEIEQIVFNNDAVTKRSRIVRSIREQSDVVFVPFEKWNEEPTVERRKHIEEFLLKYPTEQWDIIYSEISPFQDGLAKVRAKSHVKNLFWSLYKGDTYTRKKEENEILKDRAFGVNKFGFINEDGVEVIPCVYDSIAEVSKDKIFAVINGVEFVLNKRGEIQCLSIDNNRNVVETKTINYGGQEFLLFSKQLLGYKYGVKDKDGNIIVPCCFDYLEFIDEEHFLVYIGEYTSDGPYNHAYVINRNLKILNALPLSYEPFHFSEGLSVIRSNSPRETNCYNYIDIKGKIAIEGNWRQASPFSNGIATVRKTGSSKQPYYEIDIKGNPLTTNLQYGIIRHGK